MNGEFSGGRQAHGHQTAVDTGVEFHSADRDVQPNPAAVLAGQANNSAGRAARLEFIPDSAGKGLLIVRMQPHPAAPIE